MKTYQIQIDGVQGVDMEFKSRQEAENFAHALGANFFVMSVENPVDLKINVVEVSK